MIAVGFQHYLTGEPLNDPRYVKWINTYQGQEGSSFVFEQANLMKPCTEKDYEKFNPPDKQAQLIVEKLKNEGVLFCLDDDLLKTQAIRGMMNGGDNRYIDLIAMPCHAKESAIAGSKDNVRKDCVRDREAFYAYLDNMSTVTWYNYSTFKHSGFE